MRIDFIKPLKLMLIFPVLLCCQGEEGEVGPAGLNSLIAMTAESVGSNCQNGGLRVASGLDKNLNNVLDADEITSISFVCNGINGMSTLNIILAEPMGNNCSTGGIKINSGIDTNSNGLLDGDEIKSTGYVCNGLDGKVSLITILQEPAGINCLNGGSKISSGLDTNENGTLETSEVSVERYICDGKDGAIDEQIRLFIVPTEYSGIPSATYQLVGKGFIDFDIRFFQGVDSVIFTSNPYINSGSGTAYVELFNVTDDVSISNSELSSSQLFASREYIKSPNIYSNLPAKRVELGLRAKGSVQGSIGNPYIILYRRQ